MSLIKNRKWYRKFIGKVFHIGHDMIIADYTGTYVFQGSCEDTWDKNAPLQYLFDNNEHTLLFAYEDMKDIIASNI